MDPADRKKSKGPSSEDRRRVFENLRKTKLPDTKKSRPDVSSKATNATVNDSGAAAHSEERNRGKHLQVSAMFTRLGIIH